MRADYPSVWSYLMAVHAMMQAANKAAAAAGSLESLRGLVLYGQNAVDPALACQGSSTSNLLVAIPLFSRACAHYIGPPVYIMSIVPCR